MGLFSKNVSNDSAVETAMKVIEAFHNTKDPEYPSLKLYFEAKSIRFLFVDSDRSAVCLYQSMIERGAVIEQGSGESINKLIGQAYNADTLPSGSKMSFIYTSDGSINGYTVQGEFATEHSKAQSDYIKEIEQRCSQKGYRCKKGKNILDFLNYAN